MILLSGGTSAFFIAFILSSFHRKTKKLLQTCYDKVSLKFSGCFLYVKKKKISFFFFAALRSNTFFRFSYLLT